VGARRRAAREAESRCVRGDEQPAVSVRCRAGQDDVRRRRLAPRWNQRKQWRPMT